MKPGSQTRLVALLLALFTLAALALAVANFVQETTVQAPTDGISWTEVNGGLRAYMVPRDSPGYSAGIRKGDVVTAINGAPTVRLASVARALYHAGVYSSPTYTLRRVTKYSSRASILEIVVYLQPVDRTDAELLRAIALIYLAIGLYILLRRWTAPQATHFFVFCLTSFALYAFHVTGALDTLDLWIFWGNVLATELQPALFLHFAVSFSADPVRPRLRRTLYALFYLPAAVLTGLHIAAVRLWTSTGKLQHRLDQLDYSYLAAFYLLAALVFWVRYRREALPLQRQQLKWLSRGTVLSVVPFTLLYVAPFLADLHTPVLVSRFAVVSLILLPLTFSWAIVRYRLMDVDLIVKRGVAYTLATAALVGIYFAVVALTAEVVHTRLQSLGVYGLIAAVIVTGLVFEPLKRAIQARVDRLFEQKKLDYRETLIDFGRELNGQTDLNALLDAIVERLPQTLLVTRVAVFLTDDASSPRQPRFLLAAAHNLPNGLVPQHPATRPAPSRLPNISANPEAPLDLGFLHFDSIVDPRSHLFFENPGSMLRLPDSQRRTAAALDLNYYVPCRAARHEGIGRSTVAVLGIGRTGEGDFLSSEDVELLESMGNYIGIAVQNAQLYRTLEAKMTEFERLRDFNESIVESINIGVFALDSSDRIESWNAQMEVMAAVPRAEALRRPIDEVFPVEFADELRRLRDEPGIYTLYKFRLSTPDSEPRIANITLAPLLNRRMEAVGRIILVDDITERQNMEEQLTQAEKLSSIGLLAAGVAHEVNTPLAVISSYAQMLGKQLRSDAETQRRLAPVLDKITQQTFRASEIVNGLLNFSRTGSVDFARVDLNAVAGETALLLEHQMRSAGIRLTLEAAPDLPVINGNRGKLQQVLVNLILNAKDALTETTDPRILIRTTALATGVQLVVEDNGCGMPESVLRKIYDPFFTTKTNPKEGQRKGTGLGLAVTYGIVQEHAGILDVTSTPGLGTEFRITFPLVPVPSTRNTAPTTPENALHA